MLCILVRTTSASVPARSSTTVTGSSPHSAVIRTSPASQRRRWRNEPPGVYAVLFVRLTDLPGEPQRGDEVEVDAVRYKVFEIEADTSGSAVLRLRKV